MSASGKNRTTLGSLSRAQGGVSDLARLTLCRVGQRKEVHGQAQRVLNGQVDKYRVVVFDPDVRHRRAGLPMEQTDEVIEHRCFGADPGEGVPRKRNDA